MRATLIPVFSLIFILSGCGNHEKSKIIITGSSTVAPIMASIAEAFEHVHPELRIDVQSGGSSRGVADLRKGLNHIGMISRELHKNEQDLKAIPIATDGIALIVHADNPIKNLDRQAIQDIYTGKKNQWSEFGGPEKPIVVIHKDTGRATREVFLQYFGLKAEEVKANILIGENAEGIKTVTNNPLAIGYVSIGAAEKEKQLGAHLKLLPLNGIAANTTNLKLGTYPAKRKLNLIVKKDMALDPNVLELIEFTTSKKVYPLIEEKQFVPLSR